MSTPRATELSQLRRFFSPLPLPSRQLDNYYVHTEKVRGGANVVVRLENLLRNYGQEASIFEDAKEWEAKKDFSRYQIIFSGYKGCGKSTELNRLQKQIGDDFLVLKYSITQKLDPMSLNYVELFIVTMETLFELIGEYDLYEHVSEEYLAAILHWARSEDVEKIQQRHFSVEGEAGAGLKAGLSWIGGFFAKFRMAAKSSKSMKKTIRETIEPKLSELIFLCNALIREVEKNLHRFGKKGMVIVIEDLDKIPLDMATNLFKNYANQVTALQTNVIFTFPLALVYNPDFTSLRSAFDTSLVLPMIKVNEQDGSPHHEGRARLKEMVELRMDLKLFGEEKWLDKMIQYSGGCIRDLFLMILEAGENAFDWGRTQIEQEDWNRAYQALRGEYENILSDKLIPRNDGKGHIVDVPVQDYLDALNALMVPGAPKEVLNTKPVLDLRQNLAILSYNGTEWCDVHPVMKDILRDRKPNN